MSETSIDTKDNNDVEQVNSALATDHGRTHIDDVVVSKIAGMAAREVSGVNALGGSAARLAGAVRGAFGSNRPNVQQGVTVEVGETQAAVDLSIVAEYGVAIHELAEAIRKNIINAIERMTGLEVTEVNVTVHDVHLELEDEDEDDEEEQAAISAPEHQTEQAEVEAPVESRVK